MQVFTRKPLKAQSFFQKLFRRQPPENAVTEINNLLASKPLLDVRLTEVSNILAKYKPNVVRLFARDITQLYERYLQHCLTDKALSDKDLEELKHLKRLLSLNDKAVKDIHLKVAKQIYKESLEEAVADEKITAEEREFLRKLQTELTLPEEIATELQREVKQTMLTRFLLNAVADGQLSPDEDAQFEALCKNLGVKPDLEPHTQRQLERFRLYWRIENADLPTIAVDIKLYKSEVCFFTCPALWQEFRTVTRRINYAGVGARIRIAKGVYYRVGTIAPQRITSEELKLIDGGTIYLTNKRVIFMGNLKNFTLRMERLLAFSPYSDGVELEKDSGRNPILVLGEETDVFCRILSRVMHDA
ncbi:MAG: hypothetical protein SNJ55_03720 [Chloroherpetonaceae bacterium]